MKLNSKVLLLAGAVSAVLAIRCGAFARETGSQAYTTWLGGGDASTLSTTNHFWAAGMFGFGILAVVMLFAAVRGRRTAEQ